jgi:hypothetical protein
VTSRVTVAIKWFRLIAAFVAVALPMASSMAHAIGVIGQSDDAAAGGGCGLSQAALCETFDAPAGTGNRSGQLNGTLWGVSRATGADTNFGQGEFDAWTPTQLVGCSGTTTVVPENDVVVCNGQARQAVNDNTTVTDLAMYPKQPFDFAGRTGIITFDVSNDTLGMHSEWPELWVTDQPVPTPFKHDNTWLAAPRHGFGLRLGAATQPNQGGQLASACPNDAHVRWSLDSVVVSRTYAMDDSAMNGTLKPTILDCVTAALGPGDMNHVEVHVSQSQIDVYATDAGTTAPLHHLATISNVNLTFTRGLIWIEDAHYNAAKFGGQAQHTFAWDNVGFDGPVLPRDLAFDVPDALAPVAGYPGKVNLGWRAMPGAGPQLTVPGVSGVQNASAALLTFNFFHSDTVATINYAINGHAHSMSWPYPESTGGTWRTLGIQVPLSDVVSGDNTVTISTDREIALANIDLILVAAGGIGLQSSPPPASTEAPSQMDVPAPTEAPAPVEDPAPDSTSSAPESAPSAD